MPAKHCPECLIRYPTNYNKCPVCDTVMVSQLNLLPDPDWEAKRDAKIQEHLAETREFPILQTGIVRLLRDGPWLWVSDRELRAAGMPPGFLVEFSLFELDGIVYELQGQDKPRRRWWVERVKPVRGVALVLDGD